MCSTFSILGAKLFTIKIGKTVLKAQLSIPEKSNELILGLDLLKNSLLNQLKSFVTNLLFHQHM